VSKAVKTIPIEPSRSYRKWAANEAEINRLLEFGWGEYAWLKSPPFSVNPRGILVHRVRHVTTHIRHNAESHHAVDHLCGNTCLISHARGNTVEEVLVSDPPKDRLLCAACEAVASRRELPNADRLAGRHVHRGRLKAYQTCCKGKDRTNGT